MAGGIDVGKKKIESAQSGLLEKAKDSGELGLSW